MERSVLAQDVELVVEPSFVRSVSLLVDALRQHVSMSCKQIAKFEWISREGAVKTVDLKLLRELFSRYTMIRQFYLYAKIKGIACLARLVKPTADAAVNRAAAALVEPSASVPQTVATYVVREAVIHQAAGNVGVEPDAAVVRKSIGAIVRRAATAVGHLAGDNALVKRNDAIGGNVLGKRTDAGGGNVLVRPSAIVGAQSLDWNVVEVQSMEGEGLNQPMADNLMCNLLGIEDHAKEEAAPLLDVDEVSEQELVQPEMGDDEIGESLLEEAVIPVDDEVTSELVITYDPDQPVIRVGTYFANMDEFRKAFGKFCINGEFDVHRYRNTKERKRKPRCKIVDVVFVLHDEARFEWTDDNEGTDSDWPDIPKPSEPAYKMAREMSPRRKKIVETPKMSGQPKKKARTEVVG
ncbi:hypothetical protein ACQ4PT_056571 [Festuca glaucescens]